MAAATAGSAWRASAPLPRPQTAANAVRVDNWGNFLAQRIQALYEKQEHCDLTLRFPRRDFKAHSLILHACTPFFTGLLKGKTSGHKILKMPPQISSETMAVILKFVYTGRLERPYKHEELYRTAKLLKLQILIRLLEAQRTGTPEALNGLRVTTPPTPSRPLLGRPPGPARTRTVFQPTNSQIAQKRTSSLVRAADPPADARPSRFELPETDALALRLPVIDAAAASRAPSAAAPATANKDVLFETLRQTPAKRAAPQLNGGELKRPRSDGQQGEQDITTLKEYYEEQRRRARLLEGGGQDQSADDPAPVEPDGRAEAATAEPVQSAAETAPAAAEVSAAVAAAAPACSSAATVSTPTTRRPILKQEPGLTGSGSGHKKRVQFSEGGPPTVSVSEGAAAAGHQLVTELLRQHPDLLRAGQNVKVRLVTSAGGQSHAELITVKPGAAGSGDPPLDAPLSCSLCARAGRHLQFWWADEMVKHFQAEHGDASAIDLNTLSCTSCEQAGDPKDFASVEDYFTHLKEVHATRGVSGSRACSLCNFSSASRLQFMYHEYTRHRIAPPRFITFPKCERCDFEAMTEPDLALHRQREHKLVKEYKCKDCGATFPTIGHLEQHMRKKECRPVADARRRVDQWKCEFCGMSFSRCYNLKAHLRSVHRTASETLREQKPRLSEPLVKQEPVPAAAAAAEARLDPSSEAESMSTVASSVAASLSLAVDGEYMALPDGVVPVEDEHGQISYITLRPADGAAAAGAAVVEVTQYTMPVMVRAADEAAAGGGAGSSAGETVLPDLCLGGAGTAIELPQSTAAQVALQLAPAATVAGEQPSPRRGQMAGLVSSSRIMVSSSPYVEQAPPEEEEEQPQLYQHPETGQLFTAVRDASGTTTLVPHNPHGVHVITSDHQQVVLSELPPADMEHDISHIQHGQASGVLQHQAPTQEQYQQGLDQAQLADNSQEAGVMGQQVLEPHQQPTAGEEAILGVESSHDSYRRQLAVEHHQVGLAELAAVAADAGHIQVAGDQRQTAAAEAVPEAEDAGAEQSQATEAGATAPPDAALQPAGSGVPAEGAAMLLVPTSSSAAGAVSVPSDGGAETQLVLVLGEDGGGGGVPVSYSDSGQMGLVVQPGGQVQQLVHEMVAGVSEEVVVAGEGGSAEAEPPAPDPGDAWEEAMPAAAAAGSERLDM